MKNYSNSIIIKSKPNLVYKSLTLDIDKWWNTTENSADKEGDVFKVSFGEKSYWKFKVIELIEKESVVWQCVESHQDHNLNGIDEEWINSKLFWNISEIDGNVKVDFLHEGLVTTGICYEVCSNGWDFYITDSLKSFLENGVGKVGEK